MVNFVRNLRHVQLSEVYFDRQSVLDGTHGFCNLYHALQHTPLARDT